MNEPIMFFDVVTKSLTPLRVLVLGKQGAGKTTFANRLKELHPGFVAKEFDETDNVHDMVAVNVVVGAPDQAGLDHVVANEYFTHVFWIDAAGRVPLQEDYEYNLKVNPHTMVIVDNSLGFDHFNQEVAYCMSMMGLIKL
jgi:septin family protein